MFMGTSMGMVRATMRPPGLGRPRDASSWRAVLSGVRESMVSTFQLRGRRAVVVMSTIRSISVVGEGVQAAVGDVLEGGAGVARTTSQKASISRRSAFRDEMGLPSPSEWVRDWEDEKPSPPASMDSASRRDISGSPRRGHLGAPVGAHDPAAEGAVTDQEPGVDPEVAVQLAQVLGEAGPVPGEAVLEGGQGHALDLGHHPADVVVVLALDRGQGEAAVAADHRGHPVEVGGRGGRVPEQLGVVVGVGVDDARGHDQSLGVELGGPRLVDLAHGDDLPVPDADVGPAAGRAGAVDDQCRCGSRSRAWWSSLRGWTATGPGPDDRAPRPDRHKLTDRQFMAPGRLRPGPLGPTAFGVTRRAARATGDGRFRTSITLGSKTTCSRSIVLLLGTGLCVRFAHWLAGGAAGGSTTRSAPRSSPGGGVRGAQAFPGRQLGGGVGRWWP